MKTSTPTTLAYAGSHLLAIVLGWGIWAAYQSEPVQARIAAEQAKAFRSKDRGAQRSGGGSRSAREILDEIQRNKTAPVLEVKMRRVESYKNRLVEAEALRMAAERTPTPPIRKQPRRTRSRLI